MSKYPAWVTPNETKECARRDSHPRFIRPVVPETDLCGPCHSLFPRTLASIAERYPSLVSAVLKRPARQYSDTPRAPSGHSDASSLWNPTAASAIADLHDWIEYLKGMITREQPGQPVWDPSTADTITALTVLARAHSRWLTHYPTVGPALVTDALRHHDRIANAIDARPVKRIYLPGITCAHVIEATAWGPVYCEGQLVAILRPDEPTQKPSTVLCATNPSHRVPLEQWIHLNDPDA